MVRGKHTVAAALRRVSVKDEHIDHLTEQLAEAKIKARRFERDALRLPSVLSEVERLRGQVADGTSDALNAVENELSLTIVSRELLLNEVAEVLRHALNRKKDLFTASELLDLDRLLGSKRLVEESSLHRHIRRARPGRRGQSAADLINHLDDAELRDLGFRRAGHLLRRIEGAS